MDGYIKNKKAEIRANRQVIAYCYLLTLPIVIFWVLCAWMYFAGQDPSEWGQTEIVYSQITKKYIASHRGNSYIFNGTDGRQFIISRKWLREVSGESLLVPGETYTLDYTGSENGWKSVVGLSHDGQVLIDRQAAVEAYYKNQRDYIRSLWVLAGVEVLALVIVDRLLCVRWHNKNRELQERIRKREETIRRKSVGNS